MSGVGRNICIHMLRYRILSFLGRIMTGIDNFNDVLCT